VKRALGQAYALGMIRVQERRVTAWRNESNVVAVIDPAWATWLRLRRAGVRSNLSPARLQENKTGAASRPHGLSMKEVSDPNLDAGEVRRQLGGRPAPSSTDDGGAHVSRASREG